MRRALAILVIATTLLSRGSRADTGDPEPATITEPAITEFDRDHWAFLPLERPAVPRIARRGWVRNPVDAFILARLEEHDLQPAAEADRATLLRRVKFDLVGLPPTPDEIAAFLADDSPGAYERLVDRFLASPAYGERWAQHWLDLARFAETDGFEHDKVRPQAWKYRDWVIAALNGDMPYGRFVSLQIAGDEIEPNSETARIATAFCLSGPDMPDINSQQERRHHVLNELTGTVGAVFLALQLGCAQCHDHKYDAISQADFYRLRAIFEPAVHVQRNQSLDVLREKGGKTPPSYLRIRGEWNRPGPEVEPAFPRIANPWDVAVAASADGATSRRRAALARWLTRPDHPLTGRVIANRLWQHHFGEGLSSTPSDFGVMGQEPTHPELLDWLACELVEQGGSLKSMHRLMVTSAAYRTSSRQVRRPSEAVGAAEARGVDRNFNGTGSEVPSTAESWQKLLRDDPENQLLGRMRRRRLEGEAIRDAMLLAAGRWSQRSGGPGVRPPLPDEMVRTLLRNQWTVSKDPEDHRRRSIYVFARRNLRYPIFDVFDRPDGNATCPRRDRSTTAPQSLLLLNSAFSLDCARHLAGTAMQQSGGSPTNIDACIRHIYLRSLGRQPDDEETTLARAFIDEQAELLQTENRNLANLALPQPTPADVNQYLAAALTDFALALMNTSEFLWVD